MISGRLFWKGPKSLVITLKDLWFENKHVLGIVFLDGIGWALQQKKITTINPLKFESNKHEKSHTNIGKAHVAPDRYNKMHIHHRTWQDSAVADGIGGKWYGLRAKPPVERQLPQFRDMEIFEEEVEEVCADAKAAVSVPVDTTTAGIAERRQSPIKMLAHRIWPNFACLTSDKVSIQPDPKQTTDLSRKKWQPFSNWDIRNLRAKGDYDYKDTGLKLAWILFSEGVVGRVKLELPYFKFTETRQAREESRKQLINSQMYNTFKSGHSFLARKQHFPNSSGSYESQVSGPCLLQEMPLESDVIIWDPADGVQGTKSHSAPSSKEDDTQSSPMLWQHVLLGTIDKTIHLLMLFQFAETVLYIFENTMAAAPPPSMMSLVASGTKGVLRTVAALAPVSPVASAASSKRRNDVGRRNVQQRWRREHEGDSLGWWKTASSLEV